MFGRRTLLAWAVAMAVAVGLALPASAMALTMRQGDSITIAKGEVISDDLYAFGNTITIDGTVDGDVVAFGQVVVITGDVRGSVISAAQTVRIDGTVGGSVRASGQMVDVGGHVGGDVLAAANTVTVTGDVSRDLAVGAQDVSLTGSVGRNVLAGSGSLTIAGKVAGDVQAQTTRVTVASQGSIAGNLDYTSADQAQVSGSVSGTTSRHVPPAKTSGAGGAAGTVLSAVLFWIQSLVGFVLLGLLMVFALRKPTLDASQVVADRMAPSLGAGALVAFATPVVAVIVFIVGLFVGAWWLAFVLLALYWLLLLAGTIVGSLAVGRAILRKVRAAGEPALAWSVLLGLVVVWIVAAVPFLGALAAWVVGTTGTGALVLLWMGKGQRPAPIAVAAVQPPVAAPVQPPMA